MTLYIPGPFGRQNITLFKMESFTFYWSSIISKVTAEHWTNFEFASKNLYEMLTLLDGYLLFGHWQHCFCILFIYSHHQRQKSNPAQLMFCTIWFQPLIWTIYAISGLHVFTDEALEVMNQARPTVLYHGAAILFVAHLNQRNRNEGESQNRLVHFRDN